MTDKQTRVFHYDILPEIRTRFAARAFSGKALPEETFKALVEAASFAPSCFNEQPWRFLVATGERFEALFNCLTPKNQSWCKRAAGLILLCSKKTFTQGGKPNFWHLSDAGCASGFLMLEAERRGLYAHPMAGFDKKKAREAFQIDEDYEVIEVIAVGEPGDVSLLSEDLQAIEFPKPRKHISELML